MSYDISLVEPVSRETIQFDTPYQMKGGTYAIGGTAEAWLNITWNYARWYRKDGVFPNNGEDRSGIRSIYDMTGADSIPVLQHAISELEGTTENLSQKEIESHKAHGVEGYWLPTRENAIKPLYQILAMAKMRPDGVWEGD